MKKYDIDWLNYYDALIMTKQKYDLYKSNYIAAIRLFWGQYIEDDLSFIIVDLDKWTTECEVVIGEQLLPYKGIIDFCNKFCFYMPTVKFKSINREDYLIEPENVRGYYTFRKKPGGV